MSMYVEAFNSAGALKDFVNDNTIAQANISSISHVNGQWYLFYWA